MTFPAHPLDCRCDSCHRDEPDLPLRKGPLPDPAEFLAACQRGAAEIAERIRRT